MALKGKTREASGQEAERPDEGNYKENVDIKAEFEVFIITNVCQPSWWIKNNMESGNIALPHLAISEPCLKNKKKCNSDWNILAKNLFYSYSI